MGIRCDQHMGLTGAAEELVRGNKVLLYTEKRKRTYPDGRVEWTPSQNIYDSDVREEDSGMSYTGMFEQKYELSRYIFPDGRVLTEAVQANPWSSGPVFFLALKDEKGEWVKESLWSEEDINNA